MRISLPRNLVSTLMTILLCYSHTAYTLATPTLPDSEIKAGYLYHFGSLTYWPESSVKNDLLYCIYNEPSLSRSLMPIQGKVVQGKIIAVKTVYNTNEIASCHILFVGGNNINSARFMIETADKLPILIVTDNALIARLGADILIKPDGKRLAFSIDNSRAKKSNLKISSKLLKLSK